MEWIGYESYLDKSSGIASASATIQTCNLADIEQEGQICMEYVAETQQRQQTEVARHLMQRMMTARRNGIRIRGSHQTCSSWLSAASSWSGAGRRCS